MELNVNSEITKLKKVLLHRPGHEIENFTPSLMKRFLFDDIPYLKVAQEEHDLFSQTLVKNGIEVYYIEDLIEETMAHEQAKMSFLNEFLNKSKILTLKKDIVLDYLLSLNDNKDIISKIISGIRKDEIGSKVKNLSALSEQDYPFLSDPLPNMYFTRDIGSVIGHGMTLSCMRSSVRKRETLFLKYILKFHPDFSKKSIPNWYYPNDNSPIEGGDILILKQDLLAIGLSQRTRASAIETMASNIFNSDNSKIKTILAFQLPKKRSFMHLDTVFTQVDSDKFTVHSRIEGPLKVYSIKASQKGLSINEESMTLKHILEKYLNRKVTLIKCGLGDRIIGGREQWNDASNTLAIKPGEVIVYDRNYITNRALQDNGIKTHVIKGSELSRGRGGPRCMSIPLERE